MYSLLSINSTEESTTEPVTLAEVKAWLKIDYNDEDAVLQGMIKGARQTIERLTSLALIEKEITMLIDTTSADIITLPFGTVEGLTVAMLDDNYEETELTENSDFFLRGNGLRIPKRGRYSLTYTVAPEVPEDLKEAIKMEVAERYANRGENAGEVSKSAAEKLKPHVVQWL